MRVVTTLDTMAVSKISKDIQEAGYMLEQLILQNKGNLSEDSPVLLQVVALKSRLDTLQECLDIVKKVQQVYKDIEEAIQ